MCAKSYTVGPQQYMPTFFPAGSSGTNSSTERESVLKNFTAMSMRAKGNGALPKEKANLGSRENALPFFAMQFTPRSRRQFAQPESADAHAQQAQRRMADGGGHAAHLAIFAFDEFEADPAVRHVLAETDRRLARRDPRLRIGQTPPGRGRLGGFNGHAPREG